MPLTGIRVVDLTRILAGPYATMLLGDMGADVVKVERPGRGDDTRSWGPPFVDGTSTYYLSVNRNKRSVTLDLKSPAGKALLWELVEDADVLVSNFRPGVMEGLGFGWEVVARRRPACVYAVVSGRGERHPEEARPAFDLIIQAESGLMDLTGWPNGPPTKVGVSLADEVAGLYLVQGILLALLERGRTGRGQRVEVALRDAVLSLFTFQAQQYLSAGEIPVRMGNRHPSIAPYETFEAADGTLIVGCANEAIWERLCEALERQDLRDDRRFASNADRVENREELRRELESIFASRALADWEERLGAASVPCGRARALHRVLEEERRGGRRMVVKLGDGPELVGVPIRMSASPGRVRLPPPELGAHTEEVLTALGHDRDEIEAWRRSGVV